MSGDERLVENLERMLETASQTLIYVEGLDFETFQGDDILQKAVAMNLLLIGEASSRLLRIAPNWSQLHPATPWQLITGMRNRIAHDYSSLNVLTVWNMVQESLPELCWDVKRILKSLLDKYDPPKTAPTPDS